MAPHGHPELWPGPLDGTHENHGALPTGVAWYRRRIPLSHADAGRRIYLQFEGIFRASHFYLNDYLVGDHQSGYTECILDITDCVEPGSDNVLAVRVDASEPECWSYEGGGIYRHAWMTKVDPVHVQPNGVFVHADLDPSEPQRATVTVEIEVRNRSDAPAAVTAAVSVTGPGGARCGTASSPEPAILDAWCTVRLVLTVQVRDPALWSPDRPVLYAAEVEIRGGAGVLDRVEVPFGIRSAVFHPDRGFLLNGERVKLKGMCCHQDHAGVGSAVPDAVQEYRIRRLKDMGCNAYRAAHNPPSPAFLDACDRLGMLVISENRLFGSSAAHLEQVGAMVLAHRNHPSVILWSIGNEEMRAQSSIQGPRIARTLRHVVRRLDPTRPVTMAIAPFSWFTMKPEPLETVLPLTREIDVMGFNYCDVHWIRYHELHPSVPVVVTEDTSNGPTRGCCRTDPAACRLSWVEPLREDAFTFERNWKLVAENDFLAGIFVWTGFDYRGEPTPYGWPQVASQYGVMDTCGFAKDPFHYYRAQWRAEPAIHVFPHWSDPVRPGETVTLYCSTNCEEAELVLNGRSLGRRPIPRYGHGVWSGVPYEPGRLEAIGYLSGSAAARAVSETTSAPAAVRAVPDRLELEAGGRDAAVVNVEVVDCRGRVVPTACSELRFRLEGSGRILGTGNGDPASHEPDAAPRRRAFNGLCQVILGSGKTGGTAKLVVSSPGLASAELTLAVLDRPRGKEG
jgi:beta-galactosidase